MIKKGFLHSILSLNKWTVPNFCQKFLELYNVFLFMPFLLLTTK